MLRQTPTDHLNPSHHSSDNMTLEELKEKASQCHRKESSEDDSTTNLFGETPQLFDTEIIAVNPMTEYDYFRQTTEPNDSFFCFACQS